MSSSDGSGVSPGNAVGVGGHEPEAAVAHREDREESVGRQEDRQLILRHLASQMDVAEHVALRERTPDERQSERLADRLCEPSAAITYDAVSASRRPST